jgi:hypothetical protein
MTQPHIKMSVVMRMKFRIIKRKNERSLLRSLMKLSAERMRDKMQYNNIDFFSNDA